MLFDTSEIAPASSAWRQPLQMRARSETAPGLDWELSHFGMDVDSVAFHAESNHIIAYGMKRDQCSVVEVTPTSSAPKITVSNSIIPPSPIYDMHWGSKNELLCASSEGRVYRYTYDPSRPPPKQPTQTYTLTKLKATGRPGYSTRVRRVSAHPASDETFASLENGNIHIWETESAELNISKKISESVLTALSWSPHFHKRVMVGGFSRGLRLFDVDSGEVVWKREDAHSIGLITDIAFHPFVPWWLASAGEDGVAKVWDLRCGARALATLDEHFAVVNRVAWSPTHTEILATGSFDRQFKLWSLNLPPHYVIATKRATAPVAGAGFLKRMRFHACGVMQDGSVVVAKLSDQFVEPLVPRLDGELGGDVGGRGEVPPEREVARMIYLRDFAVAFERALAVAEKLSLQQQPEMALSVLDLAYQRSTPSLDPNVHPDTPLTEALNNFQNELRNYSYYVPPGYHAKFGTIVKDEVMDRIQTLRLRLELQRAASSNMCNDILDRTREIVELLEKDNKIFPPSLLTNLIQMIMPYDLIRAIEAATDIGDVLAVSGNFNIFLPIARLLLFPTIYESDMIYDHDTDEKQEERIKSTQADERQLVAKLLNKNDVLEQLTFMKKFYTKLWGEQSDIIAFCVANQPDIILSASVNRTYLNLLLAHHQYSTFYSYSISLQKETEGTKFAALVKDIVSKSYAHLGACLKEPRDPPAYDDKDKQKSSQSILTSLAQVEDIILTVLKVLYSPSIFPFPEELTDLLDQSLKPLTQQLEKHYIQMLKIREQDPSKPSPKALVSSRAKEFEEKVKEVSEGKKNNSEGIFAEKDLKRLHNSLAGFF